MKKIKVILTAMILALAALAPLGYMQVAYAANTVSPETVNCGVENETIPGGNTGCPVQPLETSPQDMVMKIINIFSWVVGAISVIMIIVGGFKYITSGGNEKGVSSAKTTILYAIIGLVIVALAQIIVRFVLNFVSNSGNPV
jgi:hypothetical protein